MSRSQSRTNARRELAREERRFDEETRALTAWPDWPAERFRQLMRDYIDYVRVEDGSDDAAELERIWASTDDADRVFVMEYALAHHRREPERLLDDAYWNDLVTDPEYDLATDVRQHRAEIMRYKARLARSNARKAKYLCSVCGDPIYALGLCQSCYNFRRKHKRDRTDDEVVVRNRRLMAKAEIQEERRAARRVLLEHDH